MSSIKMPVTVRLFTSGQLLCLLLSIYLTDATIEIYDQFGRKVDSFQDREAAFDDDFLTMEGFLVGAEPSDACSPVAPPTFLTNFTISKFILVNGTQDCAFMTKIRNVDRAGFDVAIVYDPIPMPFEYIHLVPYPRIEFNVQVVFVSYDDGLVLKNNYLYNNSFYYNYRIRLRPNTPDITYYMYLFGAVIGVCFFVMLLFMMCLLIKCIQERRRLRRNRLSSRQIKQIPTAKFSKGDQYDVCAICLEDYNEGDKLRILPCSHAYHAKCIDPWLMNNRRNCPLCKRKITFGDSGDESESEDSELTSPAENTPLLTSASNRSQSWGTFAAAQAGRQDGSGPSSLPRVFLRPEARQQQPNSDTSSENQFLSEDDTEALLPPPHRSVNRDASARTNAHPDAVVVVNPHASSDPTSGFTESELLNLLKREVRSMFRISQPDGQTEEVVNPTEDNGEDSNDQRGLIV